MNDAQLLSQLDRGWSECMNDAQLLSQLDRGGRSALMMLSCERS
jgi:hypothetical protein